RPLDDQRPRVAARHPAAGLIGRLVARRLRQRAGEVVVATACSEGQERDEPERERTAGGHPGRVPQSRARRTASTAWSIAPTPSPGKDRQRTRPARSRTRVVGILSTRSLAVRTRPASWT